MRMLERNQGLRPLVRENPQADPQAPIEKRYSGLANALLREAFDKEYAQLLLELKTPG